MKRKKPMEFLSIFKIIMYVLFFIVTIIPLSLLVFLFIIGGLEGKFFSIAIFLSFIIYFLLGFLISNFNKHKLKFYIFLTVFSIIFLILFCLIVFSVFMGRATGGPL